MAKKFGKFLLFSAVAGAVAAGAYYYLQNKNSSYSDDLDDDDDFDDFSDDLDEDITDGEQSRSYVALNFDKVEDVAAEAIDKAETVAENIINDTANAAESKVEEFFDDEDEDNSADSV